MERLTYQFCTENLLFFTNMIQWQDCLIDLKLIDFKHELKIAQEKQKYDHEHSNNTINTWIGKQSNSKSIASNSNHNYNHSNYKHINNETFAAIAAMAKNNTTKNNNYNAISGSASPDPLQNKKNRMTHRQVHSQLQLQSAMASGSTSPDTACASQRVQIGQLQLIELGHHHEPGKPNNETLTSNNTAIAKEKKQIDKDHEKDKKSPVTQTKMTMAFSMSNSSVTSGNTSRRNSITIIDGTCSDSEAQEQGQEQGQTQVGSKNVCGKLDNTISPRSKSVHRYSSFSSYDDHNRHAGLYGRQSRLLLTTRIVLPKTVPLSPIMNQLREMVKSMHVNKRKSEKFSSNE